MEVQHSIYKGIYFHPKPIVHVDHQLQATFIVTPWGPVEHAEELVSLILEYIERSKQDDELTSPFPKLTNFSSLCNQLRIAFLIANQNLWRKYNHLSYSSGLELFGFIRDGNEIAYLSVGSPNVLTIQKNTALHNLISYQDFSAEVNNSLPPLPQTLIGIDPQVRPNLGSLRSSSLQGLLLISRNRLPPLSRWEGLEKAKKELVNDDENQPFWLGHILLK